MEEIRNKRKKAIQKKIRKKRSQKERKKNDGI